MPEQQEYTPEFNQLTQRLIEVSSALVTRFFNHINPQFKMPLFRIALEDMRVDSLSHYYHIEKAPGDPEIIIGLNSKWAHRPLWEMCESFAHEMIHVYISHHPTLPKPPNSNGRNSHTHTATFASIARSLGLNIEKGTGLHTAPATGEFERIMTELGITKPDFASDLDGQSDVKSNWWNSNRRGQVRSQSTLVLYVCEDCILSPQCKIRSGRDSLDISCNTCGGQFTPVTSNDPQEDNSERFKFKAIS